MRRIVDPSVSSKLQLHSQSRPAARLIGSWQPHRLDRMHEPEGGEDTTGGDMRVGLGEMKKYMDSPYERHGAPEGWDDMNGVLLDSAKVKEAKAEEMRCFKNLGVYNRVVRSMVKDSKGEFNTGKNDSLYASTPPLEALRLIVSHAAYVDPEYPEVRRELMVNGVRRAYSYAETTAECVH